MGLLEGLTNQELRSEPKARNWTQLIKHQSWGDRQEAKATEVCVLEAAASGVVGSWTHGLEGQGQVPGGKC